MINMISLGYMPSCLKWIYSGGSIIMKLAVAEKETNKITVYDSTNSNGAEPLTTVTTGHAPQAGITSISFCAKLKLALSTDTQGMVEFWKTDDSYEYPESFFDFKYKMKTDLYDLAKTKSFAIQSHFSPDGSKFVLYGSDRVIRVFKTKTGKIWRQFNEKLKAITEIQNRDELLNEMEFGRRMAIEKDLMKSDNFRRSMAIFDETGKFLVYSTLLGIRVISLRTGACVKIIGLTESMRYLSIALFQGSLTEDKRNAALTLEMKGASNPALEYNCLGTNSFWNSRQRFFRSNHLRNCLQKGSLLLFLVQRNWYRSHGAWRFQWKTDKRRDHGSWAGFFCYYLWLDFDNVLLDGSS